MWKGVIGSLSLHSTENSRLCFCGGVDYIFRKDSDKLSFATVTGAGRSNISIISSNCHKWTPTNLPNESCCFQSLHACQPFRAATHHCLFNGYFTSSTHLKTNEYPLKSLETWWLESMKSGKFQHAYNEKTLVKGSSLIWESMLPMEAMLHQLAG